jgi:flagellar export protein FliJ
MKRFKFELESVLQVRQESHEAAKIELSNAAAAADDARDQLERLQDIRKIQESRLRKQSTLADPNALFLHSAYLDALSHRERRQSETLQHLEEERSLRQTAAVEAAQEAQIIEKIRERQYQTHRQLVLQHEQAELDEAAILAFGRNSGDRATGTRI